MLSTMKILWILSIASVVRAELRIRALNGPRISNQPHRSGSDIPVIDELSQAAATNEYAIRTQLVSENTSQWNIRSNIPGLPNIDYPIYSQPPTTNFVCQNRHDGYYADVESRCQVFRVCANTDLTGRGFAFLCPNGTLFNQKYFVCDWYRNVDCLQSERYYSRNNEIGKNMGSLSDLMEVVQRMLDFTQPNNNNPQSPFNLRQFDRPTITDAGQSVEQPLKNLQQFPTVSRPQEAIIGSNKNDDNAKPTSRNRLPGIISTSDNRDLRNGANPRNAANRMPTMSSNPNRGAQRSRTNANKKNANSRPAGTANPIQSGLFGSMEPDTAKKLHILVNSLGETMEAPEHVVASIRESNMRTSGQNARRRNRLNGQPIQLNDQLFSTFSTNQSVQIDYSAGQTNYIQPTGSNRPIQQSTGNTNNELDKTTNVSLSGSVNKIPTMYTGQLVYTGQGNLLGQSIGQQIEANLQENQLRPIAMNPNGQTRTAVYSGEGNLLNQSIGQSSKVNMPIDQSNDSQVSKNQLVGLDKANILRQSVDNLQNGAARQTVYSGEGNLLSQTIGQIGLAGQTVHSTNGNHRRPIGQTVYSGEGNLLSQSIGQNGPTVTAVFSGEGNLLSQSFGQQRLTNLNVSSGKENQKSQQRSPIQTIRSGEGNLLSQSIGQNSSTSQNVYSGNGNQPTQSFGLQGQTVYSGEGILLSQTIGQNAPAANTGQTEFSGLLSQTIGQNGPSIRTVYSGEGNLLGQSIVDYGPIVQTVYSGEGNLLSQSFGQKRPTNQIVNSGGDGLQIQANVQPLHIGQTVYSGEGNLLQQSIGQTQLTGTTVLSGGSLQRPTGQTVDSGEGNLLSQPIRKNETTVKAVFSGEGNLLSQQLLTGQSVYSGKEKQPSLFAGQQRPSSQTDSSGKENTVSEPIVTPQNPQQVVASQAIYQSKLNLQTQTIGQQISHDEGTQNTQSFGRKIEQSTLLSNENIISPASPRKSKKKPAGGSNLKSQHSLQETTNQQQSSAAPVDTASQPGPVQGSNFPASQYLPITPAAVASQSLALLDPLSLSPAQFLNDELNIHYESDPTRQHHSNRDVQKVTKLLQTEPNSIHAEHRPKAESKKMNASHEPPTNPQATILSHLDQILMISNITSVSLQDILELNHMPSKMSRPELSSTQNLSDPSNFPESTTPLTVVPVPELSANPIIVIAEEDDVVATQTPIEKSESLLFQGLQLSLFEKENRTNNGIDASGSRIQQQISRRGDEPLKVNSTNQHENETSTVSSTNRTKPHPSHVLRNYVAAALANNTRKDTNSSKTAISKIKSINEAIHLNSSGSNHYKGHAFNANRRTTAAADPTSELDVTKQNQGIFKEIVRHTKDVHARNKTRQPPLSSTAGNSIKLIFERAKNRSSDYKIKLKQRENRTAQGSDADSSNVQDRSFHLADKESAQIIAKNAKRNHSLVDDQVLRTRKAGIVFKDLQSTVDFQKLFIGNDDNIDGVLGDDAPDQPIAAATYRISNRVKFPNADISNRLREMPKIKNTDILPAASSFIGSSKTIITFQPSYELADVKTPLYWNTKTYRPHHNQLQTKPRLVSANYPRNFQPPPANDQIFAESVIHEAALPYADDFQQIAADEIVHFSTIESMAVQPPPSAAVTSGTDPYSKNTRNQATDRDQIYNDIKIIPSRSWYMNDSNERNSYFNSI